MATLVFDIATIRLPDTSIDQYTKEQWEYRHKEAETPLYSLSPLTGTIVAIGLYDIERRVSVVYCTGGSEGEGVKVRSESELLEDFWDGALSYDVFVTFGGHSFDIPFLRCRSLTHGLSPSIDFPTSRSVNRQQMPYHVDLKEEIGGRIRPFSLHQLCRSLAVESPDTNELNGSTIETMCRERQYAELTTYLEGTTSATAHVYEKWLLHLAPAAFKNLIL